MVNESNIIIYKETVKEKYKIAIKKAVIYGILSVPYTKDNMNFGNSPEGIKKRIVNIAKGKVAEYLFEQYCKSKGYSISTKYTETPFWSYDKNDFIINGVTVDLKNNFVYGFNSLKAYELPALVPKNQFDKNHFNKVKSFNEYNNDFYYVFSFLPKTNGDFFDIHLTEASLRYIGSLNNNCCGEKLDHKPEYFTTVNEWFKQLFDQYGKEENVVTFSENFPELVICGYASRNQGDMNLFTFVPAGETFKTPGGNIYTKRNTNSNGNYFTPIKTLRPFVFDNERETVLDERFEKIIF